MIIIQDFVLQYTTFQLTGKGATNNEQRKTKNEKQKANSVNRKTKFFCTFAARFNEFGGAAHYGLLRTYPSDLNRVMPA